MMRPLFHRCVATAAVLAFASSPLFARTKNGIAHYARPGSTSPFSAAVAAGELIFLSGQIGVEADGSVPAAMADQARLAMDGLGRSLAMASAGFDDVVKCTVMLADMRQWSAFNAVYITYFRPGRLPARSAFGATALAGNAGVEVECIAARPARGR